MKYILVLNDQDINMPIHIDGKIILFDAKPQAEYLVDHSYYSIRKKYFNIEPIDITDDGDSYISFEDAARIITEREICNLEEKFYGRK